MQCTCLWVFGLAIILVWGCAASAQEPPNLPEDMKPQVRVTISKETTHITEPLRSDGYVDYLAALNRRSQEGVTPENNAAVPLFKAMWPAWIGPKHRDEYCRMLGIEPLPAKGDYFVQPLTYTKTLGDAERRAAELNEDGGLVLAERLEEIGKRLWSKKEYPAFSGWLAVNEKPLSMVIEASKRPRRYDPLIANHTPLLADFLWTVPQYKDAVQALTARAMLRLGEGKTNEAWEDLLACHRLARLMGQGPTMLDARCAMRMDLYVCAGGQALLQQAQLSADTIAKMRDDLARLPPMCKLTQKIDVAERYMDLDCTAAIPRLGLGWALRRDYNLEFQKTSFQIAMDTWLASVIEVDVILRMENVWYDRIVDAYRKPTRAERTAAFSQLERDLNRLGKAFCNPPSLALKLLASPRNAISEWFGYNTHPNSK